MPPRARHHTASMATRRDLKPENCIYSTPAEDSALKITDFGLAALVAPESERLFDRHLVGTPGYIAPEILTNYEYSPASDLWAAGVILFILLSGSPPFYGRTHKEIFEKIKAGHWGFHGRNWGQVSDGAKDLVKKMLKQAPGERLTLAGVLEHPWIREHESLPSTNLPDTLESLAKFNARQKFRAAAMVCIGSSRLQKVLGALGAGAGAGADKEAAAVEQQAQQAGGGLADVDLSAFTPEELERLKAEFGKATEGGGSSLTQAQFEGVMAKLGLDHLPVARLFKAFDADGTGDIDYREFLMGVSNFRLKGPEALKCEWVGWLSDCACGWVRAWRLSPPTNCLTNQPTDGSPPTNQPTNQNRRQSPSRSSTRTTPAPSPARSSPRCWSTRGGAASSALPLAAGPRARAGTTRASPRRTCRWPRPSRVPPRPP